MITIDFQNVEDLIFRDKKIQALLPELTPAFNQWKLVQLAPYLRSLKQRVLLDVLNSLPNYTTRLQEYFGDEITINKLDYMLVRHMETSVNCSHLDEAPDMGGYSGMCAHRDKERIYISFWR